MLLTGWMEPGPAAGRGAFQVGAAPGAQQGEADLGSCAQLLGARRDQLRSDPSPLALPRGDGSEGAQSPLEWADLFSLSGDAFYLPTHRACSAANLSNAPL